MHLYCYIMGCGSHREQAWCRVGLRHVQGDGRSKIIIAPPPARPPPPIGLHVPVHIDPSIFASQRRSHSLVDKLIIRSYPASPGIPVYANEASPAPWYQPMMYTLPEDPYPLSKGLSSLCFPN